MVQTRAQSRAQRGPDKENHPQDVVARRASSRKTSQKPSQEPPAPKRGRRRGISQGPGHQSNSRPSPPKQDPPVERPSPAAEQAPATAESGPRSFIDFWRREGHWPRQFFEPGMERLYARKRYVLSASGGRKRSNSSAFSATPSDQRPREEKFAQYRELRYEKILKTKGVHLHVGLLNSRPPEGSLQVYRDLLHGHQPLPQGSIFDEAVSEKAFVNLRTKNEARVIQDLSRLLVPSAETLALYSQNSHLAVLSESVNEGWNNSIPICGSRPQPDYAVGFGEDAFSRDQRAKLSPFVGEVFAGDVSFFMATDSMFFPFLSCEVKCGAAGAGLVVADRQNAHSTALAVRGVVELFLLLGRGDEVNRQILAFSVSHDHETAKIYGHYPVIDGQSVQYFRHAIKTCHLAEDREDMWTPYRFTRNVYDVWMPKHLHRLRSAIDQLPLPESEASLNDESTGLSQSLEALARPPADPALLPGSEHSQSGSSDRTATPTTSVSKPGSTKRKKISGETSKGHA